MTRPWGAAGGLQRPVDVVKRAFDLVVATPALIVSLPIQAAVALAVRRKLGSPVLFKQVRPGRDGRPFTMLKFRSMREPESARAPESDQQRLTSFGHLLRSTSLDELPGLWNVVRGDMSLVGPRPLLTHYLPHYTPEQSRRHDVRPGLTGLAQVSGRNRTTWEDRLARDVEYVDQRSLSLDLRILYRTVRQVIARADVTADGHATMPSFTESLAHASANSRTGAQPAPTAEPARSTEPPPGRLDRTLVYGVTVGLTADVLLKGQLRHLAERGWAIHLVCSPGPQADRAAEREGVALHGLPMTRGINPVLDARALLRWIRLLRRLRPAAVNVGTPKAALVGSIAAWLTRVPIRVYVVRGLRLETETGLTRWLLWSMEKLTVLASTDVVVVSQSLRDELAAAGLARPEQTVLIGSGSSNGVDAVGIADRVDAQDRPTVRDELGLTPEQLTVGFIGRLSVDKGILELVAAMSEPAATDLHLVTMGEVEDESCLTALQRLGRRWHQVPPGPDITPVLAAIDVLCLPTKREGFPNVVLEAAAAGVPTVTTKATGARDSVIDGVTGLLVDLGEPGRLAEAFRSLADDPERRVALGATARERARTDFVPTVIWDGLDEIYRGDRR